MRNFMKNIFVLLLITLMLTVSGCGAPKPKKISFAGKMKPINFNDRATSDNNIVIKSSKAQRKTQSYWDKSFVYLIDENQERSPEFFYAIAHADKIIAHIKPPFIDYVFSKVESDLRGYGIKAIPELLIEEEGDQEPQVVLECIKSN